MSAQYGLDFGGTGIVSVLACLLACGRRLHKRRAERAALRTTTLRNLENLCSPRLAERQLQQSPSYSELAL